MQTSPLATLRAVLVTGAGGFIGSHVTRRLAREPGMAVRAGTRAGRVMGQQIAASRVDVLDPASLRIAFAGLDAVVHCAVGDRATTVEGTANVLKAAREAGLRRVVHMSSIAVYGGATGAVDEEHDLIAVDGPGYAHWKSAAEAECRKAGQVVILRPTIVYGAGSQLWVGQPARRILSGHWGRFGAAGEGICNLLHVADLAEAVLAALRTDVTGEAFNINGPTQITWNTWFSHLAAAMGHPELPEISPATWRRRSLTALPAKALIRAVPLLRGVIAPYLLAAPSGGERKLYALKATYPATKAEIKLGWHPRVGLAEGVENALAWLQAEGIVR